MPLAVDGVGAATAWLALFGAPSSQELFLVFLAVLLLFGAKRLPQIARNLGKAMEEFRRAARDVTDEIMHGDLDSSPRPRRELYRKPGESDDHSDDEIEPWDEDPYSAEYEAGDEPSPGTEPAPEETEGATTETEPQGSPQDEEDERREA